MLRGVRPKNGILLRKSWISTLSHLWNLRFFFSRCIHQKHLRSDFLLANRPCPSGPQAATCRNRWWPARRANLTWSTKQRKCVIDSLRTCKLLVTRCVTRNADGNVSSVKLVSSTLRFNAFLISPECAKDPAAEGPKLSTWCRSSRTSCPRGTPDGLRLCHFRRLSRIECASNRKSDSDPSAASECSREDTQRS